MRKKKTDARKAAKVRAAKAAGASYRDIQRRFGIPAGTVANILKVQEPLTVGARHASDDDASDVERSTSGPITRAELNELLADQVRTLRADLQKTKEPSARAAINRALLGVQQVIARTLAPESPSPEDNPDMIKARDEALAMMLKMVDQAVEPGVDTVMAP